MSGSIIASEGALSTEPARLIGAIGSVLTALVALAVVLGLDPELGAAILAVLVSVLPFGVGAIIRQRVYSPDTVKRLVGEGVRTGINLTSRDSQREL